MLRLDAETYAICQGTPVGPEQQTLILAVDGAHSAGKTTVIRDYITGKRLHSYPDIDDFGTKQEFAFPESSIVAELNGVPLSKPSYNSVCVTTDIDGTTVPIVVAAESARMYDSMHPQERALTDGYSRDGQASITMRLMGAAQGAAMSAAAVARQLQPDRLKTVSLALIDRGILSGFEYAWLRLPEEDHTVVDLAAISDIPTPSHVINVAQQAYEFASVYDKILLVDHAEVAFEDDGKRVIDGGFRNLVAEGISQAYRLRLPEDRIDMLRGDRLQRKQQIVAHIRDLLTTQLSA